MFEYIGEGMYVIDSTNWIDSTGKWYVTMAFQTRPVTKKEANDVETLVNIRLEEAKKRRKGRQFNINEDLAIVFMKKSLYGEVDMNNTCGCENKIWNCVRCFFIDRKFLEKEIEKELKEEKK